uniref:Uncharacterized protein n=1 Tax=Oryza nivara TaxID=4536 RepID=A0A0E0FU39_ORYNI
MAALIPVGELGEAIIYFSGFQDLGTEVLSLSGCCSGEGKIRNNFPHRLHYIGSDQEYYSDDETNEIPVYINIYTSQSFLISLYYYPIEYPETLEAAVKLTGYLCQSQLHTRTADNKKHIMSNEYKQMVIFLCSLAVFRSFLIAVFL